MKSERHAFSMVLAALAGIALWCIAAMATTRREPWDDSIYWVAIYPLAIAVSAMLGYRYPQKPALLALLVFESQFLAMVIRSGEAGNLWPLGMVLFAIVALPAVLVARIAAAHSPYRTPPDKTVRDPAQL